MIHRLWPRSIRSRLLLTTVVSVGAALVDPGGRLQPAVRAAAGRQRHRPGADTGRGRADGARRSRKGRQGRRRARDRPTPATGRGSLRKRGGRGRAGGRRAWTSTRPRCRCAGAGTTDVGDIRLVRRPRARRRRHQDRLRGRRRPVEPYEEAQRAALVASIACCR